MTLKKVQNALSADNGKNGGKAGTGGGIGRPISSMFRFRCCVPKKAADAAAAAAAAAAASTQNN